MQFNAQLMQYIKKKKKEGNITIGCLKTSDHSNGDY